MLIHNGNLLRTDPLMEKVQYINIIHIILNP